MAAWKANLSMDSKQMPGAEPLVTSSLENYTRARIFGHSFVTVISK